MNGTNSRRGFLKGFGLFSAVVAGTTVPDLTKTNSTGMGVRSADNSVLSPVVDKALAPTSDTNLTLTADNSPREAMRIGSDGTWQIGVSTPQPVNRNSVAMSVGKDNRLWLQVNGEWRRVALEG